MSPSYDAIATVQEHSVANITKEIQNELLVLTGKVLLVDDNVINQHVGMEMLRKLGLDCDKAANGLEALEARKIEDFDIILMDCQMPVMDGLEATRQIRIFENAASKSAITIVALTANAMEGDRERCIAAGMNDYLSKPYTMQELSDVLSQTLAVAPSVEEQAVSSNQQQLNDNKELVEQTDIINSVKFEETKELMGDSFNKIMDAFIESGMTNITEMNRYFVAEDYDGIRNSAHALKGSSAMLGIQALSEACKEIEACCRLENIKNMDKQIEEIGILFEKSQHSITALVSKEDMT